MGKFNETKTIKTVNKCGHAAYAMKDKQKLVTQVLTSFINEKKFYGDNTKEMQETISRVIQTEPEFVAKLAVFARREFNMRSVAHLLVCYLAHEPSGKPYAKKAIKAVCLRGDDATEILSCYISMFGKPIPNGLRRALREVLQSFDEYTLAKYKGEGKTVKMRDVLCLCRPKPKNDQQSLVYKKLLEGTLEPPMTWEVELSKSGNNKETWEKLISSGKIGYMALLRNLRNVIQANPDNLDDVLNKLSDPVAVRKSRQLPFRFLSAYKEVYNISSSKVMDSLESAIESSVENIQKIPGTTVIAVDSSGSMSSTVSEKSKVRCFEIGMLLGMIASKVCENTYFYTFDDYLKQVAVSSRTPILEKVFSSNCGGCTRMELPFQKMISDNIKADRIIVISDNQCNSRWFGKPIQALADDYRKTTGNNIWVHAIDLQGYGTQQFHGSRTNIIAGWSEKVIDFIMMAEKGEGYLEERIAKYEY